MSMAMLNPNLPDPTYDSAYYDGVMAKRLFAWVIDVAVILLTMALLSVLSLGVFFVLWLPTQFVVAFFYRWLTLRQSSATLGMRVMNIELRSPTGARLTSSEAAKHTATFLAAVLLFPAHILSVAMMLARPLNRGLPDEIWGTVMLNRSAQDRP